MELSFWRQLFDDWMNKNGYDIDKTDCMWAVLTFVQHLEQRDAHNPDFITNRSSGQAAELNIERTYGNIRLCKKRPKGMQ